jgi:hypothetical protein
LDKNCRIIEVQITASQVHRTSTLSNLGIRLQLSARADQADRLDSAKWGRV